MQSFNEWLKEKGRDEIIDKIIELKTKPQTEDVKLQIQKLQQQLKQVKFTIFMIKIDVKVGDTILVGRFKNKRTKVKTIEYDEFGMPIINGRPACTFRLVPNPRK